MTWVAVQLQCHLQAVRVPAHRLRARSEELIISLVHRSEVVHSGNEDIDLDHIGQATSGFFKNGPDVLQRLSLCCRSVSNPHGVFSTETYSPVLDCAFHSLGRLWVDADISGAVDHAIVLDGLGELRERLGSLRREYCFGLAHLIGL